jgi:Fic family protein
VHAQFLESNRALADGKDYWKQAGGIRRWFLQAISPGPLLGFHEDGKVLLHALRWLENNCRKTPLNEDVVRQYHRLVCTAQDSQAGQYRKHPASIKGSTIPRANPERIAALMKQLDGKLAHAQSRFDSMKQPARAEVLEVAVDIHQRLGLIHPFWDGNGRVSRLAMNHLLRRYHLGYVVFPPLNEKLELMDALQEAHRGRPEQLLALANEYLHEV